MGDFKEQGCLLSAAHFWLSPLLKYRFLITQQFFLQKRENSNISLFLYKVAKGLSIRRRSQKQAVAPWSRAPIVPYSAPIVHHGVSCSPR